MSLLFTPGKIGNFEIKNRFVRAPIYEGLARKNGFISEEKYLLRRSSAHCPHGRSRSAG